MTGERSREPLDDDPISETDPSVEEPVESIPVDPHYLTTWDEVLRAGPPKKSWGLAALLIGTLALFVLSLAGDVEVGVIAVLVGVVLLHEAGHFAGMKYFGYGDVKMFFIPFFAGAVTGEKHAAPAWQQCVVILLGPLPGIFLGAILYAIFRPGFQPVFIDLAGQAVAMLLVLNTFNLLPVEPLDGGRFLNRALFSRHPVVEMIFLLLAAVGLGLIGWFLKQWVLTGLAAVGLLTTFHRYRVASLGRLMRRKLPDLPADLRELSEHERLALYGIARAVHLMNVEPKTLAVTIKSLHQSAVVRPPSLAMTALLLGLYISGWVVSIGTVVFMALDTQEAVQGLANLHAEINRCQVQIDDLEIKKKELLKRAEADPAKAADLRAEAGKLQKDIQALNDRVQQLGVRAQEAFARGLMENRRNGDDPED